MPDAGAQMYDLITTLYPICRSITGTGLRRSLQIVAGHIPLNLHEVPTGTQVFDWVVPKEWNIRSAHIIAPSGEKIVDFAEHNLHVVSYSRAIDAEVTLDVLKQHLHSLPTQPDLIPYRTNYYGNDWGFCLSHRQFLTLEEGTYRVKIDADLADGHLTYGELFIPGEIRDEVLFSSHICHPSLCNDNLSGVALCTYLAKYLQSQTNRHSYRFLFAPGTIGAITWLSRNRDQVKNIKCGLTVACVGDPGMFHYKRSRQGHSEIDRAAAHILRHTGHEYQIHEFTPYGYDERQYCSPGFDLAVGSLTRTPAGQYDEYHTSGDNLSFVTSEALAESFGSYLAVVNVIETNKKYYNLRPYCEPQLGRRGLYRSIGGGAESSNSELAMLWVLNLSDGSHDLLDIAERSDMPYHKIESAATLLREHDLLAEDA